MSNLTFDFADRVVVVTGAARGVGRAIAGCFSHAGARVVIADADADAVAEAAQALGATGVVVDVSSSEGVAALVDEVDEEHGRLDIVVNNAGILRDRMLWKLTDSDWDSVQAVHAEAPSR